MTKYAGAVIYRRVGGATYVLIQATQLLTGTESQRQTILSEFPGGSNEDHPEETDDLTILKRELYEELYLQMKDSVRAELIFITEENNDIQFSFYFIPFEDFDGELRTEKIVDGNKRLYPPVWVGVRELGENLDQLYHNHWAVYDSVLYRLLKEQTQEHTLTK